MIGINTNNYNNQISNNLNQSTNVQQKLINQLASGLVASSDNPAGAAMINNMMAQLNGNTQGMQNANDGISMIQTADDASANVTDLLQQQQDLALQSMNGTYNAQDRGAMNTQYQQLSAQIDQIATNTSFNGTPLMANLSANGAVQNGAPATININTGNGNTSIQLGNFSTSATGGIFGNTPFNTTDISSDTTATTALNVINSAVSNISDLRSGFGATQNSLIANTDNIANNNVNLASTMSQIQDTDYAKAIAASSKQSLLQQANVAIMAQSNHASQNVMSLLR